MAQLHIERSLDGNLVRLLNVLFCWPPVPKGVWGTDHPSANPQDPNPRVRCYPCRKSKPNLAPYGAAIQSSAHRMPPPYGCDRPRPTHRASLSNLGSARRTASSFPSIARPVPGAHDHNVRVRLSVAVQTAAV